ncbi:uroporphyrinogen-III synthase [Tundrisphaera lichenicola]|uniref:uroporphyrinogen-III synthase n=1 Tax=Tundrisphaera lichenicola TaxID=2029860 RepID=UPI003EBBE5B7
MNQPIPPATPTGFAGLRVACFEARMAGLMADLIRKHGGEPIEAPALREIPIGGNPEALAFADSLIGGGFDLVVFLTGVGTRYLAQEIETKYAREEWLAALGRIKVAIRGPKPLVPLREFGVRVDLQAPEPNTWRDLLQVLDERIPVDGLRVAVQEYGQPNPELIDGLKARGATVTQIPVYRWSLPEDSGPLRRAIVEVAEGRIGAVTFTSAQQVVHLLQVAAEMGREAEIRQALGRSVVVGSVGPTTTETLKARCLPVDVEPEHPKMGHLVAALATRWRESGKARPPA